MDLKTEWLELDSPAGSFSAYLSRPAWAQAPLPGVIVIQEVWGVDSHIQDVADRLAAAGYGALAPDLYSVGGRPAALEAGRVAQAKAFLNTIPLAQWQAVIGDDTARASALAALGGDEAKQVGETLGVLFGGLREGPDRHLKVLRAAVSALRAHPVCDGRGIGTVGFCMGGGLSALLASEEADLAGAAVFYGSSPSDEQAARIHCPLRGFYGQDDPRIVSGLPAFGAALTAAGVDHELCVYPDTGHAFFNDTRPSYRPEAARDAWGRLLEFFGETLGPVARVAVDEPAPGGG